MPYNHLKKRHAIEGGYNSNWRGSRMIGQTLSLLGLSIPRLSQSPSWPRYGRDNNCEAERRLPKAPVSCENHRLGGAFPPYQASNFSAANAAVSTRFSQPADFCQIKKRMFDGYSVLQRIIGGIWRAAPGEMRTILRYSPIKKD